MRLLFDMLFNLKTNFKIFYHCVFIDTEYYKYSKIGKLYLNFDIKLGNRRNTVLLFQNIRQSNLMVFKVKKMNVQAEIKDSIVERKDRDKRF